jgi:class 3 adenylate cyclase
MKVMSMARTRDTILDHVTEITKERDMFRERYLKMRANYETKIQELSILKELGDTLGSSDFFDRDTLFWNQVRIIAKYTGMAHIHLMLFNERTETLEVAASSDYEGPVNEPVFVATEESTLGQVMLRQEPLLINDVEKDCSPEVRENVRGGSVLYMPLLHSDKAMGILVLVHGMKNGFNSNHLNFFRLVADRLVVTIVLSRFYTQMLQEEGRRCLLARFFSKTVTEKILSSEGEIHLGGERRRVTIIFADLHGFTSLSEEMDQEKVVEILNTFFSTMTPIIFKHNGTLDKFIGDAMMAIFGAPISHDDDPFEAIQVAVEMMRAREAINQTYRHLGWPELKVSIGVNSGEVVAGYIGSEDHLNYTVIGDVVNTASRLQSSAGPNEILAGKTVIDLVGDRIGEIEGLKRIVELPPRRLKGKEKEIAVYRIDVE